MMNGFDTATSMAVTEMAYDLANIFEENIEYEWDEIYNSPYKDVVYLTEDGMKQLGEQFESIVEGLRGAVFESLLDELTERSIPFDINQFKSDETVH